MFHFLSFLSSSSFISLLCFLSILLYFFGLGFLFLLFYFFYCSFHPFLYSRPIRFILLYFSEFFAQFSFTFSLSSFFSMFFSSFLLLYFLCVQWKILLSNSGETIVLLASRGYHCGVGDSGIVR